MMNKCRYMFILLRLLMPKGCPLLLGSCRKESQGWEKCRGKIHCDLGLRVCVCPVSPPNICTCVLLSVVVPQ